MNKIDHVAVACHSNTRSQLRAQRLCQMLARLGCTAVAYPEHDLARLLNSHAFELVVLIESPGHSLADRLLESSMRLAVLAVEAWEAEPLLRLGRQASFLVLSASVARDITGANTPRCAFGALKGAFGSSRCPDILAVVCRCGSIGQWHDCQRTVPGFRLGPRPALQPPDALLVWSSACLASCLHGASKPGADAEAARALYVATCRYATWTRIRRLISEANADPAQRVPPRRLASEMDGRVVIPRWVVRVAGGLSALWLLVAFLG